MKELILRNVRKSYPVKKGARVVLDGIDLTIPSGQFVVILGPSGCGKTTLLKIIAGLIRPDEGDFTLTIDGEPITEPGPDRNIVFQAYTSFPWLSALENVRFGLRFMDIPQAEQYNRAASYLEKVGLSEFANDYPKSLSGGQQQRVAIARTLAAKPDIILMDEPFASLDSQTRDAMQSDLLEIWRATGSTILFVTHDISEAAFLGERVLVLTKKPARIIQEFSTVTELEDKIKERIRRTVGPARSVDSGGPIPLGNDAMQRSGTWVREQPEFIDLVRKLKQTIAAFLTEEKGDIDSAEEREK